MCQSSVESHVFYVSYIYGEKEYLARQGRKEKRACKKPQMVANINKPFPTGSNIRMFFYWDLEDVHSSHDDALVIKVQISNAMVSCIFVDDGSGYVDVQCN